MEDAEDAIWRNGRQAHTRSFSAEIQRPTLSKPQAGVSLHLNIGLS